MGFCFERHRALYWLESSENPSGSIFDPKLDLISSSIHLRHWSRSVRVLDKSRQLSKQVVSSRASQRASGICGSLVTLRVSDLDTAYQILKLVTAGKFDRYVFVYEEGKRLAIKPPFRNIP